MGVGVEGDGGYVRFHARTWIPACAGKTVWRVAVGGG